MPVARIRTTDSPVGRLRNTDVVIARTSARPTATTSERSIAAGTPIGLLLALTYAVKRTVSPIIDALGPVARIRITD